jgi:parallel beta-helix repeat protein
MFSDDCVYRDNRFENNGAGVAVMYSRRVIMKHNLFVNNWGASSYGLLLKEITDSEIFENEFSVATPSVFDPRVATASKSTVTVSAGTGGPSGSWQAAWITISRKTIS